MTSDSLIATHTGWLGENADSARPVVSVVIPTFNRAHRLGAALRSVLDQTFQDFEIIIVDDASTDATLSALREFSDTRISVLRHPVNRGAAASRNTAIALARGQYIALLDSDDTWLPDKLERQLVWLKQQGGKARAVCTGFELVLPGDRRVQRTTEPLLQQSHLYLGCRCGPGSTLMVEAKVFGEAGLFDEALRRLEDWDWLLRCSRHTPIGVIQDVLAIVYVEPRKRGLYPVVWQAANHMQETWCGAGGEATSRRARRALIGTLRNELAAVAYSEGKMAQALWHIVVSLAYLPRRGGEFFRRIGYRIYCDVHFLTTRAVNRLFGARERRARRAAAAAAAAREDKAKRDDNSASSATK
ncbi:MAG: glycosyltransferase family 2 protein [Hyphomicrobiaceae bacterium]